jgi:hypothetical protein
VNHHPVSSFDIDVDLGPLLGADDPMLLSDTWYLMRSMGERFDDDLQAKVERAFGNELLLLQWRASRARSERRRAVRAPLLSRVEATSGQRFVTTDISLAGLRCSGRPLAGVLDIEFKLPTLAFPVSARAEVANFQDSPVIPLIGLRFVDIEAPYVDEISRYIDTRRAAA